VAVGDAGKLLLSLLRQPVETKIADARRKQNIFMIVF
jgi:hypothetical protein